MSVLNTDPIWLALGDFYNLFPNEDRIYWITFWETYGDIIADLWGHAFQVDRAKSLYATTPTFERRDVLIRFSNLVQGINAQFRISSLKREASGLWVLRGFVSRDLRTFRSRDLPVQGLIRIGVDLIPYLSVNATTDDVDFVREATFMLDEEPPHDYGDDPDFNDDFSLDSLSMILRIDHADGDTVVDAVGENRVNASGILVLAGEEIEYDSVIVVGNRYVFTLASPLTLDHARDQELTIHRHDVDRWIQNRTGSSRIIGRGDATMVIDLAPSTAALVGQYELRDNVDFDVAVVVRFESWSDPVILPRRAVVRMHIGGASYDLGIESRVGSHAIIGHTTEVAISEAVDFEARFKRAGAELELQFRRLDSDQYLVIDRIQVSGARATMDLVVEDNEGASRVAFDEVIRHAGEMAGQTRLEEYFSATEIYPYAYDIDQRVTSAAEMSDRPRPRLETLATIAEIVDSNPGTIDAQSEDAEGVPEAGVLTVSGQDLVYDQVVFESGVHTFSIRGKLDPDIVPVAAGTSVIASTRKLKQDFDYELTGDGGIALKHLPTRDRMWAPVAQIDELHIQKTFGKLVDLSADISTQQYLNRVQGTWFALMNGAAIFNVHSGLQLAMGLPVSMIAGTIVGIREYFDDLGRRIKRVLTVRGAEGEFEHDLDPSLYPHIDWSVDVGQVVEQYEPLTNGVEVLDIVRNPLWHERFPGVSEVERFNSFGIFVAIESLSSEANVDDAVRFALRIKPTYTKMVMRFLLTSGDEDLSDELDDTVNVVQIPHICEDMTLPEGQAPEDWLQVLTLGDDHKLGQSKRLGGTGQWHPRLLGTYRRQGPYDDGEMAAGSEIFTASGGYWDSQPFPADGSVVSGSPTFTTGGLHTFTSADVGKHVVVLGDSYEVLTLINPTSVTLAHTFTTTASGLDWELRTPIFVPTDLAKNIHVNDATDEDDNGDFKIVEVDAGGAWVRVLRGATGWVNTEVVNWELRDYDKLGEGWTLGELRAFHCLVPADHEGDEFLDSQQIVTIAAGP